jgi:hypothetical protein
LLVEGPGRAGPFLGLPDDHGDEQQREEQKGKKDVDDEEGTHPSDKNKKSKPTRGSKIVLAQ